MFSQTEMSSSAELVSGYRPGLIGDITKLHATYYFEHWGFHINFETQVATELSEFCLRLNPDFDGLWSAHKDGNFLGSIAIDGSMQNTQGARLRWFIVRPDFQGTGLGKALFTTALGFCVEKRLPRVFLWTFKGLEAARHLYEKVGFVITEDHTFSGWGSDITEQKFEVDLETLIRSNSYQGI